MNIWGHTEGNTKGFSVCWTTASTWKKENILEYKCSSTTSVQSQYVPLTQSQAEQDQVFSLLSNTKQVGINPASCNKAETGTKVNKCRLLEVYSIWPFTSLCTTQTVDLPLHQTLQSVLLLHPAGVYYRTFVAMATRMSKDSKFVISLHSCFVSPTSLSDWPCLCFTLHLIRTGPAGLRHHSTRVHSNNEKLDERICKWGEDIRCKSMNMSKPSLGGSDTADGR